MPRSSRALALSLAFAFAAAPLTARAELAAWDAAKVGTLAKQLDSATRDLYDTFYKQPKAGAGQSRDYYRLKQDIRQLRGEAQQLSEALAKGGGREETLPVYEDLMQMVRRARTNAAKVFTTQDVQQKASVARDLLNQIAPYYEANPQPLEPATR